MSANICQLAGAHFVHAKISNISQASLMYMKKLAADASKIGAEVPDGRAAARLDQILTTRTEYPVILPNHVHYYLAYSVTVSKDHAGSLVNRKSS